VLVGGAAQSRALAQGIADCFGAEVSVLSVCSAPTPAPTHATSAASSAAAAAAGGATASAVSNVGAYGAAVRAARAVRTGTHWPPAAATRAATDAAADAADELTEPTPAAAKPAVPAQPTAFERELQRLLAAGRTSLAVFDSTAATLASAPASVVSLRVLARPGAGARWFEAAARTYAAALADARRRAEAAAQ
jgi:hypothetical protein